MDWKKKLLLAAGAFASMPAAVTAHPDLINGKRRRRTGTLRRRTASVPFVFDPKVDQSVRVNVRVPINKARRRVYGQSISRCNSYRVKASLAKIELGVFNKLETGYIKAGGGTTIEFDMTDVLEPTAVTAKVEVTPTDVEDCMTTSPLTSFTLKGTGGRDFLPTRVLDPVLLKLWTTGPIIIK